VPKFRLSASWARGGALCGSIIAAFIFVSAPWFHHWVKSTPWCAVLNIVYVAISLIATGANADTNDGRYSPLNAQNLILSWTWPIIVPVFLILGVPCFVTVSTWRALKKIHFWIRTGRYS
jgi:hypothetical protein